jgi:predicted amidohydrolase
VSFDSVIRNGRWFDGAGAPSAIRNIGIRNGHVAAITPRPLDEADCPRNRFGLGCATGRIDDQWVDDEAHWGRRAPRRTVTMACRGQLHDAR